MKNNIGMKGTVELYHVRNGIKTKVPNTVVTEGKDLMAGLLASDVGGTAIDYMAVGVGSATITAGDTTIGSEVLRQGTAGTQTTTTTTNDTSRFIGSFSFSGTWAVNEAGLFNASSAGSMLSRTTFGDINVVSGDSINATWDIQFT